VKYKDDVASLVEDPQGFLDMLDPDLRDEPGTVEEALTFTP
jgi:hypothetical protein